MVLLTKDKIENGGVRYTVDVSVDDIEVASLVMGAGVATEIVSPPRDISRSLFILAKMGAVIEMMEKIQRERGTENER